MYTMYVTMMHRCPATFFNTIVGLRVKINTTKITHYLNGLKYTFHRHYRTKLIPNDQQYYLFSGNNDNLLIIGHYFITRALTVGAASRLLWFILCCITFLSATFL